MTRVAVVGSGISGVRNWGRGSLDYVRAMYGVPARRGGRVVADGQPGTIARADGASLLIRIDGEKHLSRWHPTWRMQYPEEPS